MKISGEESSKWTEQQVESSEVGMYLHVRGTERPVWGLISSVVCQMFWFSLLSGIR